MKILNKTWSFLRKYPATIAWRTSAHAEVIEKHLKEDEKVFYTFIAQKTDSPLEIFKTAIIVFTDTRILLGRKRLFFGYFVDIITPDLFNDMNLSSGIIWGRVIIDTVKEVIYFSKIDKNAIPEIGEFMTRYLKYYKDAAKRKRTKA